MAFRWEEYAAYLLFGELFIDLEGNVLTHTHSLEDTTNVDETESLPGCTHAKINVLVT